MSRKHKHEEHVNHERWLVSYADFITLLFAFFVVMYAVSSANEGKYRVMADSLQAAFEGTPKSLMPVQFGTEAKSYESSHSIVENNSAAPEDQSHKKQIGSDPDIKQIGEAVKEVLQAYIAQKEISVKEAPDSFEIEMKAGSLFSSGSAVLSSEADKFLQPIGKILATFTNPIEVEGFTDGDLIQNDMFPSNWELSSARSAAVVRRLIYFGVLPNRMAAVGYADNFPVASNQTEEGKRENRRVVVVVSKGDIRDRLKRNTDQQVVPSIAPAPN